MKEPWDYYDDAFFRYFDPICRRAATAIVDQVRACVENVRSVLDLGCGNGAWLAEWASRGVDDVVGVDAALLTPTVLACPAQRLLRRDLREHVDLARTFDLTQSLEVAEHLDRRDALRFVENLVRHSDIVLFSAALPGQGGEGHVNEQPFEYWRELFARFGYSAFDAIRPVVAKRSDVASWYRYNPLLYVRDGAEGRLSLSARLTRIPDFVSIPDWSPPVTRATRWLKRPIPRFMNDALMKAGARVGLSWRDWRAGRATRRLGASTT